MSKKSYLDQMQEITKDDLFDGFLGYGLFADKIPPFLTSEPFLNFVKASPEIFEKPKTGFDFIQYENIRRINIPRLMAIPEPMAYRNLCKCLSGNWDNLIAHFKKHTDSHKYKVSRIHIRKIKNSKTIFDMGEYKAEVFDENTHLFDMTHKNLDEDDYPEPNLRIGKEYQVKADISNFFPSIYTHSLCWALVGKKDSKTNKSNKPNKPNNWFNHIDFYTRSLKSQETHGILIGPHTSNLLSEVILVVIDDELIQKGYQFIRNIDDYTCFVENNENAEQFLLDLSNALKKFNLSLNHNKTEIGKLPFAAKEKGWVRKLNSFNGIADKRRLDFKDVQSYLDTAVDLMHYNKDDSAILNYAIKVLSKKNFTRNASKYYLDTIHHLILIYPYLLRLVDDFVFIPLSVPKERIEKIANDIFKMGRDKKINEAMSYALYWAIKYNFKLSEKLFEEIKPSSDAGRTDCILLLLAYLHDKKHFRKPILEPYKKLAGQLRDDSFDEYWLFIYEVLTKSKLTRYWKKMKESKVSFIRADFGV